MELRVLRYFLAVASQGSFTKAANMLHVSQPSLSKQIMSLEEELDCKLFTRKSHSVSLTEEGTLLKRHAEEILEMAQRTKGEFSRKRGEVSGSIYIGGGETTGLQSVAEVARRLLKEYPKISFNIHSGNAEDIMEKLDNGFLDFGLIIQPADISRYDALTLPNKDTWGVIMDKKSPLASKRAIRREDLISYPLIISKQISRRPSAKEGLAKWLGLDAGKLNIVAQYNLLYNASVMAAKGLGYAIGLDGIVDTSPTSGLCFRPLVPKLESGMSFVWKKGRHFSSPASLFLEKIKQYCKV